MEFEFKYAVAVLLIVGAFGALYTGNATFDQAMALVAVGVGLFSVTVAYKSGKAGRFTI